MLTFHADSFTSAGQPATSNGPTPLRRSRLLPFGISAFLVFLLSACSGGSDPAIVGESPTSQPKGTLQVEPASFTLSEGGTISLRAKLGSQTVGASQLTWSVSPSTVATIDAYGVLTALKHGEATVTARYSSLQATSQATVWAIPRTIEALTSTTLAGIVGRSLSDGLRVRALSSEGVPVPGVDVTFEVLSGNGSLSHAVRATGTDGVARVDWTMGTVPGQQQVRARAGQLGELTFGAEVAPDYATAEVRILAGDGQAAQVVTFLPEPLRVQVVDRFGNMLPGLAVEWGFSAGGGSNGASGSPGSTSPLVTTTTDAQGRTEVFWKLGTQAGIQQALCAPAAGASGSPGSIGGGPSGAPPSHANPKGKKFVADAFPDAADSVQVTPDESVTVVEATQQLAASLVDQYGNPVKGGSFAWTTDQSGVVAVDNTGAAYGLKQGKAQVFAEDAVTLLRGSAWVTVEVRAASAVQRSAGDAQKGVVGTQLANPVAVRVVDQLGSPVVGVSVSWSVSGGPAAISGMGAPSASSAGEPGSTSTLTNSDGIAATTWTLGTTAGKQTMQASVNGLSPLAFTAEASPGPVATAAVTPASAELEVGESLQFSATAMDEFGNTVTGPTFTWSSSSTAATTISNAGLATAVAEGSAEIRATSGSVSGSAQVNVKAVGTGSPVASVIISPSAVTLEALEEKAQLTAVAEDSFGNQVPGDTIAWRSLDSSVAAVDQMGMVTAKAVGLALVVASASTCDLADTVEVKVTQVPTEVMISPSSRTLAEGESYQFSGVVKDAMGYVIPGLEVTWSSGNPSVATVDGSGTVKGLDGGTAQITGVHGSLGDLAAVTVTEVASPPEPELTGTPFFSDDFDSGAKTNANGFTWSGGVPVSSDRARSGSYSLRFSYGPNAVGADATAEQRFNMGRNLAEVWIEYYLWVPSNFAHRNDAPGNNKFFQIWNTTYGSGSGTWQAGYEYERLTDSTSSIRPMSSKEFGTNAKFVTSTGLGHPDSGKPFIGSSNPLRPGYWTQIRLQFSRSSASLATDGIMRIWIDGVMFAEMTNGPFRNYENIGETVLRNGYFLGWSNSGFTEATCFYIDDVRFYDVDPGW